MDKTLKLQAQYNVFANEKMSKILAGLSEDEFEKDLGVYFKSIKGLLIHQLKTEISLILDFINTKTNARLDVDSLLKIKNELDSKSRQELLAILEESGQKVIDLIDRLDDVEKLENIEFPGISFTHSIKHFVLAILNHSTHHRGQISACLDILKIDNDFSGMLGMKV